MLAVPYFEKALYELPEDQLTVETLLALADEVEVGMVGVKHSCNFPSFLVVAQHDMSGSPRSLVQLSHMLGVARFSRCLVSMLQGWLPRSASSLAAALSMRRGVCVWACAQHTCRPRFRVA